MTKTTPIFKTLAPGEVYLLRIIDGCVEYITNVDGFVVLKRTAPTDNV